ncbi:MAG: hypothetical protein MK097_01480 [Dechloromonas sp.]|nr:hypothetical protein [Dechloromonas sp.]
MQLPITIGLRRSRIGDGVLLLAGILAIVAWSFWPQLLGVRLVGIMLIFAGLWLVRRQLEPELRIIRMDGAGGISGASGSGDVLEPLQMLPGAIVHPWLTVVRLQDFRGCRRVVVATVDSMASSDFRQFRIFLRWRIKLDAPARGA